MKIPNFRRRLFKRIAKSTPAYWLHRLFLSGRRFTLGGREYPYFCSRYNTTWANERAVEVAIVSEILEEPHDRCLEVGNVLSHYLPVHHDVLDKYEQADGVINEDVVDYRPDRPYDLIVSISTLEHVGWDEEPRDPDKVRRAIERLKSLVAPAGLLAFTVPLGHHPHLDELLASGRLGLTDQRYMKRISRDNRWVETDASVIERTVYDRPYPYANALAVGRYRRDPDQRP